MQSGLKLCLTRRSPLVRPERAERTSAGWADGER